MQADLNDHYLLLGYNYESGLLAQLRNKNFVSPKLPTTTAPRGGKPGGLTTPRRARADKSESVGAMAAVRAPALLLRVAPRALTPPAGPTGNSHPVVSHGRRGCARRRVL